MLRIHSEQRLVFEELTLRRFEDDTVMHLKDFASKHSEVIGEAGVRRVIKLGLTQAKKYGFTNVGPVQLYIELMFLFGSGFDTDPLLPWASRVLNDRQYPEQMSRAIGLFNAVNDYIDCVIGRDRKPYMRALRRAYEAVQEPMVVNGSDYEDVVFGLLAKISPERVENLGEEVLRALVRRGPNLAEQLGLTLDRGAVLAVLMAYALGHEFANDSLYPWVEKTLRDSRIRTPEMRVEWLERRGRMYLEYAVEYLERGHGNG